MSTEKIKQKEIVMFFGRVNTTTQSHIIGFYWVVDEAKKRNCQYRIFLSASHTVQKKKPLPYEKLNNPWKPKTKLKWCKWLMPGIDFTIASKENNTNTPYNAVGTLAEEFDTIHIVAGPDRAEMVQQLQEYFKDSCQITHIVQPGYDTVDSYSGEVINIHASHVRKVIFDYYDTYIRNGKYDEDNDGITYVKGYLPYQVTWSKTYEYVYDLLVDCGLLKRYPVGMREKIRELRQQEKKVPKKRHA